MARAAALLLMILLPLLCHALQPEDYFDRITIFSDGRITRFDHMPITVFIDKGSLPSGMEGYLSDLEYALRAWEEASGGTVQFRIVDKRSEADISVAWTAGPLPSRADNALGEAALVRMEDGFYVEIELLTHMPSSPKPLSHERMKAVALHELGHAIGLWGHSPFKEDVMFPSSENLRPSARDIRTLKRLYSTPPGTAQHGKALEILLPMAESRPDDPKIHYLIGSVYLDMGEYDKAINELLRCLELDIRYMEAGRKLVKAYLMKGGGEEALRRLESMISSNPTPELLNQAGSLAMESGRLNEAIGYFERALKLDPAFRPAKRNLLNALKLKADRLIRLKRYERAIETLERALELREADPQTHLMMGLAFSGMGDSERAISCYREALKLNPGYKEARWNLAAEYNRLGVEAMEGKRWEDARRFFEEALRIEPDLKEVRANLEAMYWNMGVDLASKGREREAIEAFREAIRLNPDLKEAYLQIGVLHLKLKEYPEAISSFREALRIDPGLREARHNLAAAYHAYAQELSGKGRYAEAIEAVQKGLELAEGEARRKLRLGLGLIYAKWGREDEALAIFREMLRENPGDEDALKAMANIHIERGNRLLKAKAYSKALREFESIPESLRTAAIYDVIAYIHIVQDRFAEAIDALERAVELDPEDDVALRNLRSVESLIEHRLSRGGNGALKAQLVSARLAIAEALLGRGKLTEAKHALESALKSPPIDRRIKRKALDICLKLARELAAKGLKKDAASVAGLGLQLDPQNEELRKLAR